MSENKQPTECFVCGQEYSDDLKFAYVNNNKIKKPVLICENCIKTMGFKLGIDFDGEDLEETPSKETKSANLLENDKPLYKVISPKKIKEFLDDYISVRSRQKEF